MKGIAALKTSEKTSLDGVAVSSMRTVLSFTFPSGARSLRAHIRSFRAVRQAAEDGAPA